MKLEQVEDVSAVAKRLTVEIEPAEVTGTLEKAYKRLSKQVQVKGFRPGKAPRSILERRYGPEVNQEAAESLMKENFAQAVEASGLKPIIEPSLEPGPLDPQKPYQFSILVEIAPQIEVDGYLGLGVGRNQRPITDELIATKLEELRQTHATLEAIEVDRPVEAGDYVVVDMAASKGAKPLKNGAISNFDIHVGLGHFHPEVEKALEGMKADQEKTVTASFPEDFFHDALAGQEVDLALTLKEVRQTVLPELDDDLAKSLGQDLETLDELKTRIGEELTKAAQEEAERKVQDQLMDQILEKVSFEAPKGLVDRQMGHMLAQVERSLSYRGMSLQSAGIFEEKLKSDLEPQALRRVQEDLILEAIATKEGIEIDEEALAEAFKDLAQKTDQNQEEIRRFHEEHNLMEGLKASLLRQKTLKKILEEANIKEEAYTEEPAEEAARKEE